MLDNRCKLGTTLMSLMIGVMLPDYRLEAQSWLLAHSARLSHPRPPESPRLNEDDLETSAVVSLHGQQLAVDIHRHFPMCPSPPSRLSEHQ